MHNILVVLNATFNIRGFSVNSILDATHDVLFIIQFNLNTLQEEGVLGGVYVDTEADLVKYIIV